MNGKLLLAIICTGVEIIEKWVEDTSEEWSFDDIRNHEALEKEDCHEMSGKVIWREECGTAGFR